MYEDDANTQSQPWKIGLVSAGATLSVLVTAGVVFALLGQGPSDAIEAEPRAQTTTASPPAATQRPAPIPAPREDCSRYLAAAQGDNSRPVKDGLVGGAIGAGLGAAGGAIADGGSGAEKGAGIGGLAGVVAGALHGINEDKTRTSAAQAAYQACLARNG